MVAPNEGEDDGDDDGCGIGDSEDVFADCGN